MDFFSFERAVFGFETVIAVIEDLDSGSRYVVDSWFFDNGQPPHIVRLEDWYAGQDPVDD